KILIAWNGSTEQARATAFAMPLLKKASHVVVLTVQGGTVPGPTGEELARYLHRNGVVCEPITVQPEGRSTGDAILAHAASLKCDLLIKGAYTQPVATDDFRRSHAAHLGKCVLACLYGALTVRRAMVALELLVGSVRRVDWLSQFLLRLRPMEVRA